MATMRTKTKEPSHTTHIVKNQSARTAPIQAIAVHTTESANIPHSRDDLIGVRNWFDNPVSDASATIGIDGDGHTERWVEDARKAWTILELNSVTLNIEFVERAANPNSSWTDAQIRAGARWIAYWSIKYGIPIRKGKIKVINGFPVIVRKGIIRHSDLTRAGFGTHTDPGPHFPWRRIIKQAKWYRKNGWFG